MTGGHLLDTSFVIDYWQGQPDAVSRLEALVAAGAPLFVNEVVVCELFAGLRPARARGRAAIPGAARVHPAGTGGGGDGRQLACRRPASADDVLHLADALIAAAAEAMGAAVLTRNVRDFALAEVRVETY